MKLNRIGTRAGVGRVGLVAVLAMTAMVTALSAQAGENGMRVVKDPVTGQLRAPSPEEVGVMESHEQQRNARSAKVAKPAPAASHRRDGSKKVVLDESSLSYSVMTRNADGSLSFDCVTGIDAAEGIVAGKKAPAANKETAHDHQ